MLNTSYIVASALTPQVGSCTTNGNDPNLPFTNNRTNIGNHDAAGNVRWDGATTYAFDAENRITNSTRTVGSISTIVNYKYDGDGRRVRVEVAGGASTNFVYDAGGKLLAEYNSQNYPESGTRFRIGDHLGSTRLLFDLSGNVLQRFDYLPFGEELLTSARTTALKYGVASTVKQRFTGQMRDAETNLDYFNARYMSPNQGRFMSVDPANAGARKDTPQSWNAYSYTINSPLLYVDPSGLSYAICQTNAPCQTVEGDRNALEEFMKANPNLYLANGNIYQRDDGGKVALYGTYAEVETSADGKLSPAAQKFFTDNQGRWNTTADVVNTMAVSTAVVMTAGLAAEAAAGSQLTTLTGSTEKLVTVSRWGREGLQSGDWVMKGGRTWWNYLSSGKWQPGMGNQFAPFSSGAEYVVPHTAVRLPLLKEGGLGIIKALLGQRIFLP